VDPIDRILPSGDVGEVVIRGASVMSGYLGNPEATSASFTNGWFHTGDQGYMDQYGYIYLTGRLKELINRGGEKITPREVDEAMLSHPSVVQAVTFSLRHPTLGETVAAVVVLREGSDVDALDLRKHTADRLAAFKVPETILFAQEIPTGPTGKVQRIGLADRLGLSASRTVAVGREDESPVEPTTETERSLARMWSEVLRIDQETIGIHDQFVTLGGDSMLAVRLAARVEAACGLPVPLAQFFLAATISEQAKLLTSPGLGGAWRSLVPIQSTGERPPLFCVHGIFGDVLFYRELARELGSEQPLYGLQARGLDGIQSPHTHIAEMAAAYNEEIRETQPDGPYCLLGYSAGGSVAYEMAQQLLAAGMPVAFLGIVDHEAPGGSPLSSSWTRTYATRLLHNILCNLPHWLRRVRKIHLRDLPSYARWRWRQIQKLLERALCGRGIRVSSGLERLDEIDAEVGGIPLADLPAYRRQILEAQLRAPSMYAPKEYSGSLAVFRAKRQPLFGTHDPQLGWDRLVRGGLMVWTVPGVTTIYSSIPR
jgi:oxalate---CoA ligase